VKTLQATLENTATKVKEKRTIQPKCVKCVLQTREAQQGASANFVQWHFTQVPVLRAITL
jgi:hypothetical protein